MSKRPRPRTVFGLAFTALLVGAASGQPNSETLSQTDAREPEGRRQRVDLTAPVRLEDEHCSFGETLDEALESMIVFEGDPPAARAGDVEIAGWRMRPTLRTTRYPGGNSGPYQEHEATLRMSPAASWHNLRLTGLTLTMGWEWSARSLRFAESAPRLQSTLRNLGLELPLPPEVRTIPTEACAASIAIVARGRASALVCSSGC